MEEDTRPVRLSQANITSLYKALQCVRASKGFRSTENYSVMPPKGRESPGLPPPTLKVHCVQKKYRILQGRQTTLGWRWNRPTSSLEALDFEVALTVSGSESVSLCTECFSIPFLSLVQLEVTGSLWFRASDQSWPFLLSKLLPLALVDNNNKKNVIYFVQQPIRTSIF